MPREPEFPACELGPDIDRRADNAEKLRVDTANNARRRPATQHPCNEDETEQPSFVGNFTKGLPHDRLGEVDPDAYNQLRRALHTSDPAEFEKIKLGCTDRRIRRRLENPQAAFAYTLQGADSHALAMKPAPNFASVYQAAEMAELYWMALARDIPFSQYAKSGGVLEQASVDLHEHWERYFDPKEKHDWQPAICPDAWTDKSIDQNLLFRGPTAGDCIGPHVSQLLVREIPYGAQVISPRIRTLQPDVNYITSYDEWLNIQNGCDRIQSSFDPVPRLIRNGRDLAQFVHADTVWQAFLNAGELMAGPREPTPRGEPVGGLGVPFGPRLPYINPCTPAEEEASGKSATQIGFVTFGKRHLESMLLAVAQLAEYSVWYQKWAVHRRARPEDYGGRVHLTLAEGRDYKLPISIKTCRVLKEILAANGAANRNRQNFAVPDPSRPEDFLPSSAIDGFEVDGRVERGPAQATYLLPMVHAEGSPMHPAYGSGHSTVAGACATVLKAFFDERWVFPNVLIPEDDGLSTRLDRSGERLTVAGEVDKLASNVGVGRLWAGVHWRSDHTQSLRLGEQVAIRYLEEIATTFNERFAFEFTPFFPSHPGERIEIKGTRA